MSKEKTFEELAVDERGTVYIDAFEEGVRYLIVRGGGSLCAYLGIPMAHPLAGKDYDDLPLDCHGGLTFGSEGDEHAGRKKGWYWYGWDYAHSGDKSFYDFDLGFSSSYPEKEWVVSDVKAEIWSVAYDFKRLMRLVEKTDTNDNNGG